MKGLALALSWLTVLPVRTGAPDARTAASALRWAPLVGALIGAATGAVLVGLALAGVPPLVAGLLAVGFAGMATRGMHLDGLADTADGLGCYGPPERALAVMRDGGAGPFAVVTLLVVMGTQAAALAALATSVSTMGPALGAIGRSAQALAAAPGPPFPKTIEGPATTVWAGSPWADTVWVDTPWPDTPWADTVWADTVWADTVWADTVWADTVWADTVWARAVWAAAATALAAAAGRAAFAWVARRSVPAARPGGLGATVAGSQPWWVAVLWWTVLAACGYALAGPRGVLAIGLGAAVVVVLSRHTARRFGGMTGDVLGAASELATTAALVVLTTR